MSLYAATLPGHPGQAVHCRQQGCPADFGIVYNKAWKRRKWHEALKAGRQATAEYLEQHNQFTHRPGCPFRDLPPAVHAISDVDEFMLELKKLNNSRNSQASNDGGTPGSEEQRP